jgi:hypothetical protein
MKVSELSGALLDGWVAKGCRIPGYIITQVHTPTVSEAHYFRTDEGRPFSPSRNWADGGPILEREYIRVGSTGTQQGVTHWFASIGDKHHGSGTGYLVAAMRAFVMSKFGDEVSE